MRRDDPVVQECVGAEEAGQEALTTASRAAGSVQRREGERMRT